MSDTIEKSQIQELNVTAYTQQAFNQLDQAELSIHGANLMLELVWERLQSGEVDSKYLSTAQITKLIAYDTKFSIYERT